MFLSNLYSSRVAFAVRALIYLIKYPAPNSNQQRGISEEETFLLLFKTSLKNNIA